MVQIKNFRYQNDRDQGQAFQLIYSRLGGGGSGGGHKASAEGQRVDIRHQWSQGAWKDQNLISALKDPPDISYY
jgi:hypothetical protein